MQKNVPSPPLPSSSILLLPIARIASRWVVKSPPCLTFDYSHATHTCSLQATTDPSILVHFPHIPSPTQCHTNTHIHSFHSDAPSSSSTGFFPCCQCVFWRNRRWNWMIRRDEQTHETTPKETRKHTSPSPTRSPHLRWRWRRRASAQPWGESGWVRQPCARRMPGRRCPQSRSGSWPGCPPVSVLGRVWILCMCVYVRGWTRPFHLFNLLPPRRPRHHQAPALHRPLPNHALRERPRRNARNAPWRAGSPRPRPR